MFVELLQSYPRISVIIVAFVVSLFITTVQYLVMDKSTMRDLKQRQKDLQKRIKEQSDPQRKMELSQEMMKHSLETMKHSLKPMIITLIPVLIVFWFIRGVYVESAIGGSWIWYYIGSAIVASIILRKVFKLP